MASVSEDRRSGWNWENQFAIVVERLQGKLLWYHLLANWGWVLVAGLLGLITLTWWDWQFESSLVVRQFRLLSLVTLTAIAALWTTVRGWRYWSRRQTALALESTFPELGQRLRTGTQLSSSHSTTECRPGLRRAFFQDTVERTILLPLDQVLPIGRLAQAIVAGLVLTVVWGAAWLFPESRIAAARTLLIDCPYTEWDVGPGDRRIDQGQPIRFDASIFGRQRGRPTLFYRPAGQPDAEWMSIEFSQLGETTGAAHADSSALAVAASEATTSTSVSTSTNGSASGVTTATSIAGVVGKRADAPQAATIAKEQGEPLTTGALSAGARSEAAGVVITPPGVRQLAAASSQQYSARLNKITESLEYRVTAGSLVSPTWQIVVRRPLAIRRVSAELTPPAYTGIPPRVHEDANLAVLAGTTARFHIELDRPIVEAEIRVTRLEAGQGTTSTETYAPDHSGGNLVFHQTLTEDIRWSVFAVAEDGATLPENVFRVRIRPDEPPQVTFEEPAEETEVHTLAEVPLRVRVNDDYGLSRAAIIFQVNNGEEHELAMEEFGSLLKALQGDPATTASQLEGASAESSASTAGPTQTRALIERILPLEYFSLTQKDCVVYRAFAEDNLPGGPQRAETDLRFLDIRPFRQRFRLPEPGNPDDPQQQGPDLPALEELISRERQLLNRTVRLSRRAGQLSDRDLSAVERLSAHQTEIADLTRQVAEGLAARGADVDLMFQAEASMLAAVDSLTAGRFENAVVQEKDAQQYLVETRDLLEVQLQALRQNAAIRRAVQQLNAMVRQRLRRQDSDRQQSETAQALVERLLQLAGNEAGIASMLAENPPASPTSGGGMPYQPQDGVTQGTAGNRPSGEESTDPVETPGNDSAASHEDAESSKGSGNSPSSATNPEDSAATGENATSAVSSDIGDSAEKPRDPAAERQRTRAARIAEAEKRQYDALAEAQDIRQALGNVPGLSKLVSERMQRATERIDQSAGELTQGRIRESRTKAAQASRQLGELARQVAAMTTPEFPDQIARARDLVGDLSTTLEQLAEDTARGQGAAAPSQSTEQPSASPGSTQSPATTAKNGGMAQKEPDTQTTGGEPKPEESAASSGSATPPGEASETEPTEPTSGSSPAATNPSATAGTGAEPPAEASDEESPWSIAENQIRERTETVRDVLQSLAGSPKDLSGDGVERIAQAMADRRFSQLVERLLETAQQPQPGEAQQSSLAGEFRDQGERMGLLAVDLDRVYRSLVMPRLEQLRQAEERAAALDAQLAELEGQGDIQDWLGSAGQLVEELKDLGIAGRQARAFEEQLAQLTGGKTVWTSNGQRMIPPAELSARSRLLVDEVERYLQELILSDVLQERTEITPPEFTPLVERFLRVLAETRPPAAGQTGPRDKAE